MGATREIRAGEQAVTLSQTQVQQMRDIARACGADPDFLLRVVRETRVERRDNHVGLSNSIPSSTTEQMRAVELAFSILRQAYEGPQGARARPEFTSANLGAAAYEYMRTAHTLGPETTVLSERTGLWLRRQAERFGMNIADLTNAIQAYSGLIEFNPTLARQALKYGAGMDVRIESFAIAFTEHALVRQRDGTGNTELYLRTADAGAVLAEYRRETGEDVLRARPRRMA